MNILILGSGGREHALAWKIAASPLADRLYCAPGNAGIAREAECVALDIADHAAVIAFCREASIDLVVVGPEAPLCAGIVDDLEAAGIKAFGPSRAAARLEGSKGFTKDLCRANTVPTAAYERFRAPAPAKAYVQARGAPIVIKADGLAAGKGVVVAQTLTEAEGAIDMMFAGGLGDAGGEIVIEDFLEGEEASFFALCDGETAIPLATAQDHKRAFDGVLYAGLMITAAGPKLIEYNARFGDPETQVLMLRLKSDLVPALLAARDGMLKSFDLRWYDEPALTVVMAAKGYPGAYVRGTVIEGLEAASSVEGVEIFHAGTKAESGKIVANGGRVLSVSAIGKTVRAAQGRAYAAVAKIVWPEGFYRHDIGWRAVTREMT